MERAISTAVLVITESHNNVVPANEESLMVHKRKKQDNLSEHKR